MNGQVVMYALTTLIIGMGFVFFMGVMLGFTGTGMYVTVVLVATMSIIAAISAAVEHMLDVLTKLPLKGK